MLIMVWSMRPDRYPQKPSSPLSGVVDVASVRAEPPRTAASGLPRPRVKAVTSGRDNRRRGRGPRAGAPPRAGPLPGRGGDPSVGRRRHRGLRRPHPDRRYARPGRSAGSPPAACTTRSRASGRCSPSSTTRWSRRSGSTSPGRVFIARRGRSELTTTILRPEEVRDLVEKMLKSSGRRVDLSTPFVDATLPDGSRLHVVIPDITRQHWAVNIRKFVRHGQFARRAGRARHAADVRPRASSRRPCVSGLNIIVAGGTQAGKTTLLNCLAAAIPARERVVTCEEVFELRLPLPDVVVDADPAGRTSKAPARCGCAGWSRKRCGCGPSGSSSARSAKRSASTCSSR